MSNPYRSHDQLFNSILVAYENAGVSSGITEGDDLYRNGAALASTVWGLYRECDSVRRQIYLDTADEAEFLHGAYLRGFQRNAGEPHDAFVRRVLARIRTRYSGGNIVDVVNWAMEVSYNGESASSVRGYDADDAYGPGTIALVVDGTDGPPSSGLLGAIKAYVASKMVPAPAEIYVLAEAALPISISITMVDGDPSAARQLIETFMSSLEEGQAVHPAIFQGFCYQVGASTVTVSSPASVVRPGKFERVTVGSMSVWTI